MNLLKKKDMPLLLYIFFGLRFAAVLSRNGNLLPTHNREPGSIALASLSAVLVLCDAAVGGQSIFFLHLWDIQIAKWGQEETVTWGEKKEREQGEEGKPYVSQHTGLTKKTIVICNLEVCDFFILIFY